MPARFTALVVNVKISHVDACHVDVDAFAIAGPQDEIPGQPQHQGVQEP